MNNGEDEELLRSIRDNLREMNDSFGDYVEAQRMNEVQKRVEAFQTLTALGIVGGFITAFGQGKISETPYPMLFWGFAGASALYIFIKLIILTLRPILRIRNIKINLYLFVIDAGTVRKVDEFIIPLLYMISFSGISLTLVGIPIVSIISPRIPSQYINILVYVLGTIVLILSSIIAIWYGRQYTRSTEEQEEAYDRAAGRSCIDQFSGPLLEGQTKARRTPGPCRINVRENSEQIVEIWNMSPSSLWVNIEANSSSGEIDIDPNVFEVQQVNSGETQTFKFDISQNSPDPKVSYDTINFDISYVNKLSHAEKSRYRKIAGNLSSQLKLTPE